MVAAELAGQLGSDFYDNDVVPEADFAERTDWAQRSIAETATRMRGGGPGLVPRQLRLARRLLAPVDLPGGDVTGAPSPTSRRRAIGRRDGSVLVSAGAGSGKTSVLVERFVQAVLEDGCAVDSILAITFTEKAAAQLTGRVRRRFVALGEEERAREAEAAWISTIHGFCARLLRTHALAAGLDPEFRVLDALEAERLAIDAFDKALGDFVGTGQDSGRLALLAAYTPDKLADMVRTAYAHLRSQGQRAPAAAGDDPAARLGPARGAAGGHRARPGRDWRGRRDARPGGGRRGWTAARPCWRRWAPTRCTSRRS